uniref:4-hydroxy-4-methyl-2-oxoglutarate aldolase n=1 Tax=Thauera linaloolentis (strain DSM 12138 / JCM 21573 / CCUG 41526 / CIP 105981 / IAM 15112 / NBRC 102519 / 47Lol) TaxID=1123367 RepID=N6Z4H6_THAL4|nr:ribonuclease E activity regulator RraA [Thauera linaloolentis]ENO89477.1 ribonuclease activity regulator protein RraA [Thauera linaloolentis 47Lol = DSM 12138]MCM8566886.1 ribonuclease E activity regulator RraA [Thauera linaloolentis]
MNIQTADLCDTHDDKVKVVSPMFGSYGGRSAFGGPISTLKIFEDNSFVRKALESAGNGRVLVIDGGASIRCALVGDQLAELAVKNGWAGIIVYGCIRDSKAIGGMDLGVFALGTHPRKTVKRNTGEVDVPVTFGGVTFVPGHHVYADEDGVIVSASALL